MKLLLVLVLIAPLSLVSASVVEFSYPPELAGLSFATEPLSYSGPIVNTTAELVFMVRNEFLPCFSESLQLWSDYVKGKICVILHDTGCLNIVTASDYCNKAGAVGVIYMLQDIYIFYSSIHIQQANIPYVKAMIFHYDDNSYQDYYEPSSSDEIGPRNGEKERMDDFGDFYDSLGTYGSSAEGEDIYEAADRVIAKKILDVYRSGVKIIASIYTTKTPAEHSQALVELYNQTNGDNSLLTWNLSTDPCQFLWEGIFCDTVTSEILVINVSKSALTGTLPASFGISTLQRFDASRNSLYGTIPLWLCDFGNLTKIDVSFNQFFGTIPNCIGNLTNLTTIHLQENSLSGTIPESLLRLPNLRLLDLARNNLSGTISPVISQAYWLKYFYVGYNQLSGEFPQFAKPNYFVELDLSNNHFSGTIPDRLVPAVRLALLDLSNNNFSGDLPPIYQYNYLQFFSISGNHFTGLIDLDLLSFNVRYFYASNNNFSSIGNYSTKSQKSTATQVSTLDISRNNFNIPYDQAVDFFTSRFPTLQNLDISYNKFFSDSPHLALDLAAFPNLVSFHLQNNSLSGNINAIVDNRFLTSVDFSGNSFTGDIGVEFAQIPVLSDLKIYGNSLSHFSDGKGGIPNFMYADYSTITLYPNYNFSCPQIRILGSGAIVEMEASYHGWELCKCSTGYRRVEKKQNGLPFNFTCSLCGIGLHCPGQLNDAEFVINKFYWASPNSSSPEFLLPCTTCNPQATTNFSCETNYEGRLCSRCAEGFFKSNSRCHKCGPYGRVAIACSILVLLFLIVIVTKGKTLKDAFMKEYTLQSTDSPRYEKPPQKRDHAQAALSILINYHQTISALSEYFTLPISVGALVAAMRVSGFATGSGLGFQCLNNDLAQFKYYYMAVMLEPVLVIVGALLLYLIGKPFQMCKLSFFQEWGIFCTKIGLYSLNILYFPVVSHASNAFRCERDPGDGLQYNSVYPYALCDEVPLSARIVALLVYGGGIMILFLILVVKYMRNPNTEGKIFKCSNFFFDTFQDKYTFFSILIIFRRLAISLITSLLPVNSSLSFGLNTLVLTVSHLIIVYTKPYKSKTDNDLETVLGWLLLFAYGLALVISQQNLQYGAIPMEVLFFVTNLGALAWCLYELFRHLLALTCVTRFHAKCVGACGRCVACCGSKKKQRMRDVEMGAYSSKSEKSK